MTRRPPVRGSVRRLRGLEASIYVVWAGVAGTRPARWAGRCEACEGQRWLGVTHGEAMRRLCRHLRDDHGPRGWFGRWARATSSGGKTP